MDLGLRGKVAAVAAASQGMGRATALTLAREGCKVAICARNAGPLEVAARAIREETGADVLAVAADVARTEGVRAFVEGTVAAFGGVDVLVTNAGGPPTGRFEDLTEEQWAHAYELTFQSVVRLIRACVPSMRARGGGAIAAITSISVKMPLDRFVLSSTMRSAVVALVKSLSRELAKDRIRVNAVAPGWIATDRLLEVFRARAEREGLRLEEAQALETAEVPLGRFGTPQEVADLIAFLVSDRASYLTGTLIPIDGGLYRGIP